MSQLRPQPVWESVPLSAAFARSADFDFRTGIPDVSLFPFESWRRLMVRQFQKNAIGSGVYAPPAGHLELREAIARHIAVSRGVLASPEDIVITSGTQQALDIVGRVLLARGDGVAVEDPAIDRRGCSSSHRERGSAASRSMSTAWWSTSCRAQRDSCT